MMRIAARMGVDPFDGIGRKYPMDQKNSVFMVPLLPSGEVRFLMSPLQVRVPSGRLYVGNVARNPEMRRFSRLFHIDGDGRLFRSDPHEVGQSHGRNRVRRILEELIPEVFGAVWTTRYRFFQWRKVFSHGKTDAADVLAILVPAAWA